VHQAELSAAASAQQQVLVACHHPLAPGSAPPQYLAWNHLEILAVLEAYKAVVKVAFSGHYHPGGYVQCNGIHYVVYEGILEAPADSNAYAVVDVFDNEVQIHGCGIGSSRQLLLT
jgi:hypothetical protein